MNIEKVLRDSLEAIDFLLQEGFSLNIEEVASGAPQLDGVAETVDELKAAIHKLEAESQVNEVQQ